MAKKIKAENIGMLKGILAQSRRENLKRAILRIPLSLLGIDDRYQTSIRTNRNMNYLINNWDENKLLPLVVVPHDEEGMFMIVDGYGRYTALKHIYKEKDLKDIEVDCLVILCAPRDPVERLEFEAEQYAFQNQNVMKMTPVHKHGARQILHDDAVEIMDRVKEKHNFEYCNVPGNRQANVIGSYTDLYNIAKNQGYECLEFIFSLCESLGFDMQPNGYSSYILRSLRDTYVNFKDNLMEVYDYLIRKFRGITPAVLASTAVTKYPILDKRTAVSLYIEDVIVQDMGLTRVRKFDGRKVVKLNIA